MASRSSPRSVPSPQGELSPVDGLVQLSVLIQNALARRAAEHDLSLIQIRLLGVLRDREPNMNELAKLLELDKSSVSGLIDRAERRGLVGRVPSRADGRVVLVRLTDVGRALVSKVAPRLEADVAKILGLLPATASEALTSGISRLLIAHAGEQRASL